MEDLLSIRAVTFPLCDGHINSLVLHRLMDYFKGLFTENLDLIFHHPKLNSTVITLAKACITKNSNSNSAPTSKL